jgi:4-hydroxy-tetrahydrodipicolinate synthase
MRTTRRTFLGAVGATAALGVAAGTKLPETLATEPRRTNAPAATSEKILFWVAVSTPCDKNLKFDEELYKDLLAYLKSNGADGVVVLGTTGEFPSFSVSERKKIAETAFRHRNGLNIIVSPGTANFPETLELNTRKQRRGRPAGRRRFTTSTQA